MGRPAETPANGTRKIAPVQVGAVSRPDICAGLARIASRINALCGSDVHGINGLVRAAKAWQKAKVLRYASSSHPWKSLGRNDKLQGALQKRGEQVHGGSMTMVGWSDAAYGDQSTEGKCRLGYVIGLASSTLKGPCHILQWTSKFTRQMVKSSLGGEVYAPSEMVDHMLPLKEFYGPFGGKNRGVVGFLEDYESLFTHLETKKMPTEKYLARHFLSIHQALKRAIWRMRIGYQSRRTQRIARPKCEAR